MDLPVGKVRIKKFCIDNESEREECERILTKYDPIGKVFRQSECFDKDGVLYVHLQWLEDADEGDFRE